MMETPLTAQNTVSNTDGFSSIPVEEDGLKRDGGLQITLDAKDGPFRVGAYGDLFQPPKTWNATNSLNTNSLFGITRECRDVWTSQVINYTETTNTLFSTKKTYPFQIAWDFKDQPALLDQSLGPQLALAGERLFFMVFENHEDELLKDIGKVLRKMTIRGEAVFTITSEDFFVPWNMIYTHPVSNEELKNDGSNFKKEGFWGYRHIIEHNTRYLELGKRIGSGLTSLPASLNFDQNIDQNLGVTTIQQQIDFFEDLDRKGIIKKELRPTKKKFQADFEDSNFADCLVYFYCHGQGADKADEPSLKNSSLRLTDGEAITKSDISFWRRSVQHLNSHPLVFINACQGGQMTTLFYQTIATEFLRQRAVGLVGAQVDLPAAFAWEYAKRLLSRFIDSSEPPDTKVRLGPLMRDLTREFYDQHKNPLGLVYSLYRGADCYINRAERTSATG